MKETYIRFMATVHQRSTASLLQILDNKLKDKYERIHLMISSPGGSVFHGISIYNFLKGAPFEVYTYNFGSVDSIGVVIFCAGNKRFSVPHARFLIHGVSANFVGNQSLDEKGLEERLKGLQIDYKNIARVIADTAQKPADKVQNDMNNRTTLRNQIRTFPNRCRPISCWGRHTSISANCTSFATTCPWSANSYPTYDYAKS